MFEFKFVIIIFKVILDVLFVFHVVYVIPIVISIKASSIIS